MKTLYIERSTGEVRDGSWVNALDLDGVERIVVGTGPGSFAGVRSAIAFATGYALGRRCEVLGMPSACAIAAQLFRRSEVPGNGLAVIGDARQGKFWIALFEGIKIVKEVFQTDKDGLVESVPPAFSVVTPDEHRIGDVLTAVFGGRYIGGRLPDSYGLRLFAEANPSVLKPEPRPIYLNPAVRR